MVGIICFNCGKDVGHAMGPRSREFEARFKKKVEGNVYDRDNGHGWLCEECGYEDEDYYEAERVERELERDINRVLIHTATAGEIAYIRNKESIDNFCRELKIIYDRIPFSRVKFTIEKDIKIGQAPVLVSRQQDDAPLMGPTKGMDRGG
jgi:hypothetical protein